MLSARRYALSLKKKETRSPSPRAAHRRFPTSHPPQSDTGIQPPTPKTQTQVYSPTAARNSLSAAVRCAQTPPCLRPVVCGSALLPHSTIGASSSSSRREA
ncbi:hypothetical protein AAHE18_15G104100 [Arachis hypogaea]